MSDNVESMLEGRHGTMLAFSAKQRKWIEEHGSRPTFPMRHLISRVDMSREFSGRFFLYSAPWCEAFVRWLEGRPANG